MPNRLSHFKRKVQSKGFTLIELIVTVSIGLVIIGVLSSIFIGSWRAYIAQEVYVQLQRQNRVAVDEISIAIKSAATIVESHSYGGNTYQSTASSLVLRTPSVDEDGNVLTGNDYLIFRLNPSTPTTLERIVIADSNSNRANLPSPLALNEKTSSLTFTYYDSNNATISIATGDLAESASINVAINSQDVANGRTISRQLDNRVYLRNR